MFGIFWACFQTLCCMNIQLILIIIIAFLCTDPKRKYVILLKAVNSNGNGPDIQTVVKTSDTKGITLINKEFNWATFYVALKCMQQDIFEIRDSKCFFLFSSSYFNK